VKTVISFMSKQRACDLLSNLANVIVFETKVCSTKLVVVTSGVIMYTSECMESCGTELLKWDSRLTLLLLLTTTSRNLACLPKGFCCSHAVYPLS
jgi:hypothetical protein